MPSENTLFVTCTDTTIEIQSAGLTNEYSPNEYHSFAKGSFRVVENAGKIKLLFPAHNNLPIWTGSIDEIIVDGGGVDAAAFKLYQQQNFYTVGESSKKITIPASSDNQQFQIGANSWLIGISVLPDANKTGDVIAGTTPGGDDIIPTGSSFPAGVDTSNTIVKHFVDPTIIYITNIANQPVTYYILIA